MTVGGTTVAVARLKDTGYLKSTSEVAHQMKNKKDHLKKSYDEKKEVMDDKIDNIKEKYESRRNKPKK